MGHPEGVLRVCILKAQGLSNPCDVKWYMPLRSSWAANKAAPCVELALGSAKSQTKSGCKLNPDWGETEVHDFLVVDLQKQKMNVVVRDAHTSDILGRADVQVSELLHHAPNTERGLPLDPKGGTVYFKAQWRPFARENNRSALDEKHWWDLGAPAEGSVQLIADIFHVSGLHPAEDGTEHWFTISVSRGSTGARETLHQQESSIQAGHEALVHGHAMLKRLGITSNALGHDTISAVEWARLSRAVWRSKVEVSEVAAKEEQEKNKKLVDVLWDSTFCFPLDVWGEKSVQVSVWRPARGKSRQVGRECLPPRLLGSVDLCLEKHLDGHVLTVPMHGDVDSDGTLCVAQVKLRLRVCQLLSQPKPRARTASIRTFQRIGDKMVGMCAVHLRGKEKEGSAMVSFSPNEEILEEISPAEPPVQVKPRPWWRRLWSKPRAASGNKASDGPSESMFADDLHADEPLHTPQEGVAPNLQRSLSEPVTTVENDEDQEEEEELVVQKTRSAPGPGVWSRLWRNNYPRQSVSSDPLCFKEFFDAHGLEEPQTKRQSVVDHHVDGIGMICLNDDNSRRSAPKRASTHNAVSRKSSYQSFGNSSRVRFSCANSSTDGSSSSSGHGASDPESETAEPVKYSIVLPAQSCADDDSPLSRFSVGDFQSPHTRKYCGLEEPDPEELFQSVIMNNGPLISSASASTSWWWWPFRKSHPAEAPLEPAPEPSPSS